MNLPKYEEKKSKKYEVINERSDKWKNVKKIWILVNLLYVTNILASWYNKILKER